MTGTPPRCRSLLRSPSVPIWFRDRLARQRLDELDVDLLWETSVEETPMLLRFVKRLSDQMGPDSPPEHVTSHPGS
jgi:hypothetical protein